MAEDMLSWLERYCYWCAGDAVKPITVAPLDDGGVQLEWRGTGGDIEIEISPDGRLDCLLVLGTGPDRRFVQPGDATEAEVLRRIARVLTY